ncbi:MAG: hypothetical protein ACRC5M_04825 [Anaeroplasmataceae bacterium]
MHKGSNTMTLFQKLKQEHYAIVDALTEETRVAGGDIKSVCDEIERLLTGDEEGSKFELISKIDCGYTLTIHLAVKDSEKNFADTVLHSVEDSFWMSDIMVDNLVAAEYLGQLEDSLQETRHLQIIRHTNCDRMMITVAIDLED